MFTFASGIIGDYCASKNLNWIVCCEPSASGFESFSWKSWTSLCVNHKVKSVYSCLLYIYVFSTVDLSKLITFDGLEVFVNSSGSRIA